MFSIIYCFLPVFFGLYHLYLIKKRDSIIWNIKKGEICYHCKCSLNTPNQVILGRLLDTTDFSKLCVSCNRDRKIEQIKRPYLKYKHRFFKFLISGNFSRLNIIFIGLVFATIILDVILIFNGVRLGLWRFYGTINIIFYFFSIYRTKYTTKKTSE